MGVIIGLPDLNFPGGARMRHGISCTVYESARIKTGRLSISARGELTAVVPRGFRNDLLHAFLQRKRDWIAMTLSKLSANVPEGAPGLESEEPCRITLKALDEEWEIVYAEKGSGSRRLETQNGPCRLVVTGSESLEATGKLLRSWLARHVRPFLEARLDLLSGRHGMTCRRLCVRLQKTRWGSCSAKGVVSLNGKLAFLPLALVDYVICHELCHTVCLDHSSRFWNLLEKTLPGSSALRKSLARAGRLVPSWASPNAAAGRKPRGVLFVDLQAASPLISRPGLEPAAFGLPKGRAEGKIENGEPGG